MSVGHLCVFFGEVSIQVLCQFFKKILFIFRERGREGEREGEKHQCVVASCTPPNQGPGPRTQACALTGNQTNNLSVCRLVLNPLSHNSQSSNFVFYTYLSLFRFLSAVLFVAFSVQVFHQLFRFIIK